MLSFLLTSLKKMNSNSSSSNNGHSENTTINFQPSNTYAPPLTTTNTSTITPTNPPPLTLTNNSSSSGNNVELSNVLPNNLEKGDIITRVMNLIVSMRRFELEMKKNLQTLQRDIEAGQEYKKQLNNSLEGITGRSSFMSRTFIGEEDYTDLLHTVKIKNMLAVIDESVKQKNDCIGEFSKF